MQAASRTPRARARTRARCACNPPRVQVTVVGNPEQSFELFLQALITPLTLNILLGCSAVFAVGRELSAGSLRALGEAAGGRWAAALIGKLAPHVLAIWAWMAIWTAYLAGLRGWRIEGSLPALLLAQFVFLCSTAAISAFLVAATRNTGEALSLAALFFGSAMSFAGGTLPVHGGPLFTRIWSAVLPSTSYIQIQEQQWVLGSSVLRSAPSLGLLLLFCAVPLAAAAAGLRPAGGLAAARRGSGSAAHAAGLSGQLPPDAEGRGGEQADQVHHRGLGGALRLLLPPGLPGGDGGQAAGLRGRPRPLALEPGLPAQARRHARGPYRRPDGLRRSAQALLRQDRTDAALVIPHGLQASLLEGLGRRGSPSI